MGVRSSWALPACLAILGGTAAAQSLSVSPGALIFRMAVTGPVSAPQPVAISTTAATPVAWTATASANAPWISLSAASGSTPATLLVSLLQWRAQVQPTGIFTGDITITPADGAAVTVRVTWVVVPRLPDPAYSYTTGPNNCTNPGSYPDPALCAVPDEKPPGGFAPPAPGGSFADTDFGGAIRVMTGKNTYHTYSANNPLSANNKYLMTFPSDGSFNVVDAATGEILATHVKANQNFLWDSYDDSVYYYPTATAFVKHNLSDGTDTTLVDYAQDGHNFSLIARGGTTGSSKDNWISFFAPNENQVCSLDLTAIRTYCADYGSAPGPAYGPIDYVLDSKGVDRATGKRYVILVAGASTPGIYSVNLAAGRLDLEYRGPEDPESFGNHDGVCDPGEKCMFPDHSDTMEDVDGTQYLVFDSFTQSPCEVSLATYQLNKGINLLQPVELGGGKHRVMSLWQCPFPNNNGGTDDHVGCAKNAPFCVISTVAPKRSVSDPVVRFPHATEVLVMRGNGTEIRRLAESRSVRFTEDGDSSYWAEPRAAISNDGSTVVFDSNYGEVSGVRVNLLSTGFGGPQLSVLNAAGQTPGLAPGAMATIQGAGLANCIATASPPPLTPNLCGASVTFDGQPALLAYASSSQINALIPSSLAPSPAGVAVSVAVDGAAAPSTTVLPANYFAGTAPAIYSYNLGDGVDRATLQNSAGIPNGPAFAANASLPALPGDAQVLWANGLGPTTPAVADGDAASAGQSAATTRAVSVYVNGVAQSVQFSGLAAGLPGVYQVNFVLNPATPVLPEGQNFVWLLVDGTPSRQLAISIATP